MFQVAMGVGLILLRQRRDRSGTPRTKFRAWWIFVILFLLTQFYPLIMSWIPPTDGIYGGTVSF